MIFGRCYNECSDEKLFRHWFWFLKKNILMLVFLKMEPCAKWGNNQSGQLVSEGHCLGKLWTEVLTPRLHLFVASFYGTQPHQRSKRPPLHSPHAWSTCVKTSCGGRHSYKSKEALIIHQSQSRTIQYQGVSTLKSGNSENKILLSLREENRAGTWLLVEPCIDLNVLFIVSHGQNFESMYVG